MGRQTFNWWRRTNKKKKLDKKASLIDKINHGDFDTSQYLSEAQNEIALMNDVIEEEIQKGKDADLRYLTVQDNIRSKCDQYHRRYNRLMKDFIEDEDRIIASFRAELKKHFKKDHWDTVMALWLNNKIDAMTPKEIYEQYKKLSEA